MWFSKTAREKAGIEQLRSMLKERIATHTKTVELLAAKEKYFRSAVNMDAANLDVVLGPEDGWDLIKLNHQRANEAEEHGWSSC
jgi:hypothetical protein